MFLFPPSRASAETQTKAPAARLTFPRKLLFFLFPLLYSSKAAFGARSVDAPFSPLFFLGTTFTRLEPALLKLAVPISVIPLLLSNGNSRFPLFHELIESTRRKRHFSIDDPIFRPEVTYFRYEVIFGGRIRSSSDKLSHTGSIDNLSRKRSASPAEWNTRLCCCIRNR